MSIRCRSCFQDNPDGSGSCLRCGKALSLGGTQHFSQTGATGGRGQQQMFPPSIAQSPRSAAVTPPASGMGSIRRAFAGHGTLIKHHSWLLDGQNTQVMNVRQTVFDKLVQRNLDQARASTENLTDQGLVDERRDYIRYRRKSTSVFIYATPAGHDLYISRATTVQPGFSLLRVIVFALILLAIVMPFVNIVTSIAGITTSVSARNFGAPSAPVPSGASVGMLFLWIFLLLFFSLPLLWVLVIALIRSIASFMLDGDFWVLLRPNSLTEFQRDEVALMEHTTDNVVREAMKQLGLDADKITAPPNGYQPASRIRLI